MTELREKIARELEPQAWAALGTGDSLAYKSRRTSSERKADRILAIPEIAEALKRPRHVKLSRYEQWHRDASTR